MTTTPDLYFNAQFYAAEILIDELIDLLEKERAAAPSNRSKFAPAQLAIKLLEDQEDSRFADALRVLSESEDPLTPIISRLKAVKNPATCGKNIPKSPHTRSRRLK